MLKGVLKSMRGDYTKTKSAKWEARWERLFSELPKTALRFSHGQPRVQCACDLSSWNWLFDFIRLGTKAPATQ